MALQNKGQITGWGNLVSLVTGSDYSLLQLQGVAILYEETHILQEISAEDTCSCKRFSYKQCIGLAVCYDVDSYGQPMMNLSLIPNVS